MSQLHWLKGEVKNYKCSLYQKLWLRIIDVSKLVMERDNLYIFCIFQIPEQFRFMSQHPVKKKHKHKKHKSQDNERNKEGGEAVSQSGQEQEKLASSSTGMKNCQFCLLIFMSCVVHVVDELGNR